MTAWMDDELNERRRNGLYRRRRRLESAQGTRIQLGGRELINFATNDYLGYAADPRLAQAAARAARRYGCGAGASPLVSGHLRPLRHLEHDLAAWEGTEAALVFTSGYTANLATITALVQPGDAIFSDELCHASLIDGCRLSRGRVYVYRHCDLDHLNDRLTLEGAAAPRRLIVTDSVFSMDGDLAPLKGLLEVATRHDALLLVDEAHATGVLGNSGRGLTDLLPAGSYDPERIIKVGTLSKALGAQGGFVCGTRRLIQYLVNCARPYIYSTALAPPLAAAARQSVALVQAEPEKRKHLLNLAATLRAELQELGRTPSRCRCQIVPVIVGNSTTVMRLSAELEERGFLVPAIRTPSVPDGTARLRISLTAGHTQNDVNRLSATLADLLT